jgi:hypothetical protein
MKHSFCRTRGPTMTRRSSAAVFLALLRFSAGHLAAAPRIVYTPTSLPAQAHVGDPVVLYVDGLVAPVHVYFSNGTSPVIEATPINVDAARGLVLFRVPAGAVTGNMKVNANGVDSPLYYFRILPGTFNQGTDVVSGQATNGATPVTGVLLLLFRDVGCVLPVLQDFTRTDATGTYTMHGVDGVYILYALPAGGLAGSASLTSLSVGPQTVNVPLTAGTLVTGQIVDAAAPATGIPGASLDFDGPAIERRFTDATGNFSVRLGAGNWQLEIHPPAGDAHAYRKVSGAISGANLNLGSLPLQGGIHVSGVVTRQLDGTPLAGAEVDMFGADFSDKLDKTHTAGDGSYDAYVPQNTTIAPFALFDQSVSYADVVGNNQLVGTTPAVINLSALEAAIVNGTVTDLATLGTVRDLQMLAWFASRPAAVATTCADGSYRMRLVPNATGYELSTWFNNRGPAYASQTWNNTPAGTYFVCEGTPISVPTAGVITSGIDFRVPQAANAQGLISSQASGCANDLGNETVVVDDGSSHACGMGTSDFDAPFPGYGVTLLPPTSVVPSLRACAYVGVFNPQCYNLKVPPAYNPIVVGAGTTAGGINFCLTACASPQTFYRDADLDGHGFLSSQLVACAPPPGYTSSSDDCNDASAQVWNTPGEARTLVFTSHTALSWSAPLAMGGTSVVYDVIRSNSPADFGGGGICVESNDGANTTAVDAATPLGGSVFFYLVRAENACPGASGLGLLGKTSSGVPIAGRNCP